MHQNCDRFWVYLLSTPIWQPLFTLLIGFYAKNVNWKWTAECKRAFQAAKSQLASSHVVVHYKPKLPLRLAHATTGVSPSSLFLRRHMRTRFDMMRPDPAVTDNQQQSRQKEAHDRRAHCREFLVGQSVMVRNLRPGPGWIPGVIVERLGPVSYLVETSDHLL